MTAWHDLKGLSSLDKETYNGIEDGVKIVEDLIADEIKSGIPSDRIILAGFSQGAAMSLYVGLQYQQKLAGIISLSGYLPQGLKFVPVATYGVVFYSQLLENR